MDGSIFFRALTALLNLVKNICSASFVGGAFVADTDPLENSVQRSIFARVTDKIFNGIPKVITPPTHWNATLSRLCNGSWLVKNGCENLGAPIPQEGQGRGVATFFQWALFAAPAAGIALVLFAIPFLPTMLLAGLIIPILLLVVLSRKIEIDSTSIFLLVFIVVFLLAGVLSVTPTSSIQVAVLTSAFMLSTLVLVACATSSRSVDFFLKIFLVSAAFTGLYGLFQVLTGYSDNIWLDERQAAYIGLRVSSFFGNPNVYGTYLLLAIPIAAAGVVYFKGFFNKFCAVGITGLLLINLLLTFSRGCYLSLALAVGVFVLIIEKRMIVLLIPAVLALPFVLPQTIIMRIWSIFDMTDTSTSFRLNIWRGSIRMMQDFWLGGVGQGIDAYNTVYPFYMLSAIHSPHSHSLYIQYLVELGVFGFIVFIIVLACFFRTMANFVRNTSDFGQKVMATAMIAAAIGFLFQGLTDLVFYNNSVLLTFYLFMGLCIAFAKVNTVRKMTEKNARDLVSGYHD